MSNKFLAENTEFRADRSTPIPDQVKGSKRRNTRKWCKGKVGVLHEYEWRCSHPEFEGDPTWKWERQVCIKCGRKYKLRKRT